jgi:hypothetical protein
MFGNLTHSEAQTAFILTTVDTLDFTARNRMGDDFGITVIAVLAV